jgi:ribosomal protein S18 acetylase RimI-like enzyme
MHLRPATILDLELVLRHRREVFREMGGHYAQNINSFENASRKYFDAALRDGSYLGLFGEIDGSVIVGGGLVIVPWPGSPMNFDTRRAWILNIYVEPDQRRKGFARMMMQALIDLARERGFQTVSLHASADGRPLYEQFGFRPTNEMRLIL